MEIKTKIAGLMMALMTLSVPMVYADGGMDNGKSMHQDGGWHHEDHYKMMAKILNLTDDQVKQLKGLKEKQKEAMKAVFEQLKTNRAAFDSEIVKATPDMSKINDIQAKLKTIQAQMVDNHLNSILDIKKIMSPEQFAGFMALEKAKKIMMHKGHGKFGHHGDWGKDGGDHKQWGDKEDDSHSSDAQD